VSANKIILKRTVGPNESLPKVKPAAPLFFATPADFRKWLRVHHRGSREQWIGFYKKDSGKASITWPESVDEALCFGWIDGLRKTIDDESYQIRFTPRKATSTWSAVNLRRVQELTRRGGMRSAGLKAFAARKEEKSGIYSYENRKAAVLSRADEKHFRSRGNAWNFFQSQPAGYRQNAIWWVVTGKREETRASRLQKLMAASEAGKRI
jgi:uncharacterized protein YdeI (YjbR/CyaY-like superfamily)